MHDREVGRGIIFEDPSSAAQRWLCLAEGCPWLSVDSMLGMKLSILRFLLKTS